jgi:hypothetical protein
MNVHNLTPHIKGHTYTSVTWPGLLENIATHLVDLVQKPVAAENPHLTTTLQFDATGPTFILHQNLYLFNFYKTLFLDPQFYVWYKLL